MYKKKIVRLATLFAAVFMSFFVLAVASACNATSGGGSSTDVEIDIANNWYSNEDADEDAYDDITYNDGGFVMNYTKTSEWQYAKRSMAYDDANQLANVKTCVLTGSLTSSLENPNITLKFEYTEGIESKEVTFYMSETSATYEWDLTDAQLDKATRMLIFIEGSDKVAIGTFTVTKFVLTSADINSANNVETPTDDSGETVTPEVNTITSSSLTVNAGWYDNGDKVYTITANGTAYDVEYSKGSSTYAAMYAYVTGSEIANMKTFQITMKGTAGKTVIVKPFDKVEKNFTFTGGEDTISVDISGVVSDLDTSENLKIIIMAEGGAESVTGSFQIINATFSADEITDEGGSGETVTPEVNTITSSSLTVNAGWYDNGDNVYTITANGTAYDVEYSKGSSSYAAMYAYVTGSEIANMKTFQITIKGTANKTIIIKPFDNSSVETNYTLTGNEDTIAIDISSVVSSLDTTANLKIIIMVEGGATDVTGSFQIISATFATYTVNTITSTSLTVNAGWYDSGDGVYTVSESNSVYTVTYDKGTYEWPTLVAYVTGSEIANMTSLTITMTGTADVTVLIKPFNAVEQNYTFTGGEDTITVDISSVVSSLNATSLLPIYIFIVPGTTGSTGSFTISNAVFA